MSWSMYPEVNMHVILWSNLSLNLHSAEQVRGAQVAVTPFTLLQDTDSQAIRYILKLLL